MRQASAASLRDSWPRANPPSPGSDMAISAAIWPGPALFHDRGRSRTSGAARSCSGEWCSWRGLCVDARLGRDASACRSRQADAGIIADRCDGFQRHVAGALYGPFVILLQKDGADQSGDRRFVGEDPDHIGPALDLSVDALQRMSSATWRDERSGKSYRQARRSRPRPSSLPASALWGGSDRPHAAIAGLQPWRGPGRRRWR